MKTIKPSRDENLIPTVLHEEVERKYLAYALSTIVARALPDVRDGLKPVHRRILYAMHSMRLDAASRMRKSAAVVGEVIGKFHPHGDQAAYDAMVRMAQDFSLRYPLVQGGGNFGSVDGDAPAAMRYTETRLSAFAGLMLREIDQGTTEFRPTYDGMGEEPLILPAAVPNLLLNGASGIAVGMSCSFPSHNLREVMAACRAAIKNRAIDTKGLLAYIKGPDFPTDGEAVTNPEHLESIYETGHGSIRVRGTYAVESVGRSRNNLIITSIPYSVNKSRLIERIAQHIRDKRLKQVVDVRDESTSDVRIVLELKSADVKPEAVVAFLYKFTDLQINFPINFVSITPEGAPERLGLAQIISYFLDFRYEKTVQRLQFRLDNLNKRIHILDGFESLFIDLDLALRIIRSARSRVEAEQGLKTHFGLDDEQTAAILEMRLYRLVELEIDKLLEELAQKRKEAGQIRRDLESSQRLWNIIDTEFAEIARKFGDDRKTRIVQESETEAIEFNPDELVEHEDATVIISAQGWIRRQKAEVEDESALKFRDNDRLLGLVRVNTDKSVAILTNQGKVYVMKALDVPATTGFGEPISSIMNFGDGESVVAMIAPDPPERPLCSPEQIDRGECEEQSSLFEMNEPEEAPQPAPSYPTQCVVVTKKGQGFRFDHELLREPTKRGGRKLVALAADDEVLAVLEEDREFIAIAAGSGNILTFPLEQIPVLSGSAKGVRLTKLPKGAEIVSVELLGPSDDVRMAFPNNEKIVGFAELQPGKRDTKGKLVQHGILKIERVPE